MDKIAKVYKSTSNNMCIDIELTNICNYKCSYCHPSSYNGGNYLHFEKIKKFLDEIIKDKYCIVLISGGEPTLYPNLKNLLMYLKKKDVYITLMSNGSKSLEWWNDIIEYIDKLTFSYHLGFASFQSFYDKVHNLSKQMFIDVNVPMVHNKFFNCLQIAKKLSSVKNTSVATKPLKNKRLNDLFEYTEEQLNIISKFSSNDNMPTVTHIYENGKEELLTPHQIIAKKMNVYTGWKCWKGVDVLKIQSNGRYYLASCDLKKANYHGFIDESPKLPSNYSICNYDKCFCLTDVLNIRKER